MRGNHLEVAQGQQQQQATQPTTEAAAAATAVTRVAGGHHQQQRYCLVRNGELCACSQSAAAWLQAAPRGAYTTARTVGDAARVLKLGSHIARLAQSANLMLQADEQLVTHEGHPALFTPDALRPRILACIGAVIAAFRSGACAAGVADTAAATFDGAAAGNGAPPAPGPSGAAPAGAAASARQGLAAAGIEPRQLKLTMLMTWGPAAAAGPWDIWCHGEALPPRPRPPVKLQIRGLPRTNARAKDSEWVRQRRALEEAKPGDVNEVVLCDPDGRLMEGLSSNFFVLHNGEVVTADEGVLGGTIREIILQVCGDLGVSVRLEPPSLSDVPSWDAAFISSTSRLLLPADEVRWALPGYTGPGGTEKVRVWHQRHPTVAALEAAVTARILADSEAVPLP